MPFDTEFHSATTSGLGLPISFAGWQEQPNLYGAIWTLPSTTTVDNVDHVDVAPSSTRPSAAARAGRSMPKPRPNNLSKEEVDLWQGLFNANRDVAEANATDFINKVRSQYACLGQFTPQALRARLKPMLGDKYAQAVQAKCTQEQIATWKAMQHRNHSQPDPQATIHLYKGIFSTPDHPLYNVPFTWLTEHSVPVPQHIRSMTATRGKPMVSGDQLARLDSMFSDSEADGVRRSAEFFYKLILDPASPYQGLADVSAMVLVKRLAAYRQAAASSGPHGRDNGSGTTSSWNADVYHDDAGYADDLLDASFDWKACEDLSSAQLRPPIACNVDRPRVGRRPGGTVAMTADVIQRLDKAVWHIYQANPGIKLGAAIKQTQLIDPVLAGVQANSLRARVLRMPNSPFSVSAPILDERQKATLAAMKTDAAGSLRPLKDLEQEIYSNPDHALYGLAPWNLSREAAGPSQTRVRNPRGKRPSVTSEQSAALHALFTAGETGNSRRTPIDYYKIIQHPDSVFAPLRHLTLHVVGRYLHDHRQVQGVNASGPGEPPTVTTLQTATHMPTHMPTHDLPFDHWQGFTNHPNFHDPAEFDLNYSEFY